MAWLIQSALLISASKAQTITDGTIQFNHFSAEHGLSQTNFRDIIQDKKGYMWFGLWNGLIKFDGYTFTTFQFDPDNKNSPPVNAISSLCIDDDGNIWMIGYSYGLIEYNARTEKFIGYQHDEKDKYSISSNEINSIVVDHDGSIWIGTNDAGLCKYDASLNRFINYTKDHLLPDSLCSKTIFSLMIARNGLLWIGTSNGVNVFDKAHKKLIAYKPSGKNNFAQTCNYSCLFEDHSGKIWIGYNGGGAACLNLSTGVVKSYRHDDKNPRSLRVDIVNSIREDHNGTIWIATYEGLCAFDPVTDDFTVFSNSINDEYSLTSSSVIDVYEDRGGVLWIATNGGGLNTLNLYDKKFQVYQKGYLKDYNSHYPLQLYKDHTGKIWVTAFGEGLLCFDPAIGKFKNYHFDPAKSKGHFFAACYCLLEDSNGLLWTGSTAEGLNSLDPQTGLFTTWHSTSDNADSVAYNQINCMAKDQMNRLWLGTSSGLKCFDLNTKRYSAFAKLYSDTNQLSSDGIQDLYCDAEGFLWIGGTSGGLTLFNTRNDEIKIFKHDEKKSYSLSSNAVNCFYDDEKGKVWIGTEGGGLNEFDKKSEEFTVFTMKTGMPENTVNGILADDHGNLWLSGNRGLCKFTPPSFANAKATCRNYNMSDGLPGDEYYYNACARGDDGTLYFGSNAGVVCFKPEELKDNPFIPAIVITGFSVFNKLVTPNDSSGILKITADETKEITLAYSQNVFSFTFAALSYINPEKNKYAYRLEGFDKDWIYTDASIRFANYTNLDAGTYIFKVKGSNNDGVWNETPAEMKLIILPPYWQTWWFKLLCAITGGLIVYAIIYSRMQKMRDIRRIRNKIASDLHDDLGATLSSISILSEIVKQQNKEISPQSSSMLETIGSSARNMIDSVNDMVWTINPKNDNFENILTRMHDFALQILEPKDITLKFDADKNLHSMKMHMEKRKNFYLIFKEAINNIAKYSQATQAQVQVVNENNFMRMLIRDDGKGFDLRQQQS
ncbi:MAG: two-component regulator propeller domain-containing protein, partial [Chitinophagales bacterium]